MAEEIMEEAKGKKKKLSRKEKKQLKKMAQKDDNLTEEESGISVFFVTLAIILIWLLIIGLLIKLDVGGFGSSILRPIIKDIPVVNLILPGEKSETQEAEEGSPYKTVDDAIEQIKLLELQLEEAQKANTEKDSTIEDLNKQIGRLQEFEDNQVEFEKKKTQFYEDVVFADNAPDISEYKEYYESIDPENAEYIYRQVVQKINSTEELEEYAKTYASMKPSQAAGIFETMTDDLSLVSKILNQLNTEQRGEILGAMDPEIAAKLTKLLEP